MAAARAGPLERGDGSGESGAAAKTTGLRLWQ
jgi:hypothetical protein